MRVLVACEFSGVVRRAFRAEGHEVWSCDLLPSEDNARAHHIEANVLTVLDRGWDLMIAHPPCTHLAVSGARWFKEKAREQLEALEFVRKLLDAPIPRIALENPVSIISTRIRKPDQIIQPWQFGDPFNKKTCLWLRGLPPLIPTNVVEPTHNWGSNSYRGGSRKKSSLPSLHWGATERSRSFEGIAAAMASQRGGIVERLAA